MNFHPLAIQLAVHLAACVLAFGSACTVAAPTGARGLMSVIPLPAEVAVTPILEGVRWQGFPLELVALEISVPVEHFIARLAPVLPEGVLLSGSQGIFSAHWELGDLLISLYAASAGEHRATGVLTAMHSRPTAPPFPTAQTQCGDPVVRHISKRGQLYPLFDLLDPGGAAAPALHAAGAAAIERAQRAASDADRQSEARIRGFVLQTGVDALVAQLLYALPGEGWTILSRHASSALGRSVSLEAACGRRRLRIDIAHLDGRTMALAFETD